MEREGLYGIYHTCQDSKVVSAAYGGQVLISIDAYDNLKEKILEEISFRDLGERRLKDLIQPMKLYQIISSQLTTDFPPLKTLDARPNNLPVQLTSFIGRENQIKHLKDLFMSSEPTGVVTFLFTVMIECSTIQFAAANQFSIINSPRRINV